MGNERRVIALESGGQSILVAVVLSLVALLLLIPLYLGPTVTSPADGAITNIGDVKRLMQSAWDNCQQRYAAELCDTVLTRLRTSGGATISGSVGIYVEELGSGFSYGYNAERNWLNDRDEYIGNYLMASVSKLPMAYAVFRLADQGLTDLNELYYDPVLGSSYRYGPLIHEMITRSLNLNFNILLRHYGPDLLNKTLLEQGLAHTRLSRELLPAPGSSDET